MDDSLNDQDSDSYQTNNYHTNSNYYNNLDDFMENVCSKDTNIRLDVFARLEDYLKNENSDLGCMDIIKFCEAILLWVNSSNFKISINGLTIIQLLIQRLTEQLRNHSTEIATNVADRLGDSKEQVRQASKNILIFMMACYTPNFIWDKLTNSFNHKLPKVKEEILCLLEDTLNKFGASNLQLNKIVTHIVRLLADANQAVRDKSLETLIQIYCHVGDRLRNDLRKKLVPEAKLKLIFNKFDEAARNGDVKDEAKQQTQSFNKNDSIDSNSSVASLPPTNKSNKMIPSKSSLNSISSMTSRPGTGDLNKSRLPRSSSINRSNLNLTSRFRSSSSSLNRNYLNSNSIKNRNQSASANGGVDEDAFMNAFEAVPKIQIYSAKDVDQHMSQINDCLADLNNDWEKRVDSLKRIRSVAIAASNQYDDEFFSTLKQIQVAFTHQIKDLRSQIVREACITIAYLSQTIGSRLDLFAEYSMPHLINLIQNSAKVMASSGIVAIRFLIENTHTTRLIPPIASGISSRSKEIRRNSCDFLNQLLQTWETYHLEKHVQLIQTCIKKGINDADQEARVFARKAFWAFHSHYQLAADNLLLTFDVKTQKLVQTGSQGTFGSVKSLKDGYTPVTNQNGSNYGQMTTINYDFMDSQNNKQAKQTTASSNSYGTPASRIKRSTSAVDIKNSSRSNSIISSRLNNNNNNNAVTDSASINSRPNSRIPTSIPTQISSATKLRIAQSQPGSRSTSPTPKYSYLTHNNGLATPTLNNSNYNNNNNNNDLNNDLALSPTTSYTNGSNIMNNKGNLSARSITSSSATKSKIPTSSRNSSRESSPGRRSNYGSERRASITKMQNRRLFGRQLSNNTDGEQAIASAISNKYSRSNRRWPDDSDDASETSSICSERSFSSSIGGNRVTEVRDMNEAITCLSSSQWSDRRDGLVNLRGMMINNRIFSRQEIKRLCEIFTKLLTDPHAKVFTLFLEALNDFIRLYKRDLKEWLYILLTKLLTKLGSESLSSVYQKLCLCLEATRSSFDLDLQFKILIQFIKEIGQTSNLKVKVAVLKYLQDIICLMEPADFHTSDDLKYAVCRIVSLTAEPKSVEIRKTAQAVLVAFYNLNTPEFSMLLNDLPKNIQETAWKIFKNHTKNENGSSNNNNNNSSFNKYSSDRYKQSPNYFNEYITSMGNGHGIDESSSSSQLSHVIKDIQNLNMSSNNHYHYLNHHKERLNGNNLVLNKNDLNIKTLDTLSKDSGVQSNGDVDSDSDGAMTSSSTTTSSITNLPNIAFIIASLSSNSSSISLSERLGSMKDLTELIKAGNRPECKWNENFKNILFCLFNHLDTSSNENINSDQALEIQTLYALRELLSFQYKEFSNYIELTILKLVEKYKESPPNEVSKVVEEVICTAARCLPPEPCARVLKPLIETAEYPKNLMAIRMMQKTIDQMNFELCNKLLPDILNALLIAWDSSHSPVRKAAVFCLVSLYMIIGENLRDHLKNLSSSKVKLLNVYINRAKEGKEHS